MITGLHETASLSPARATNVPQEMHRILSQDGLLPSLLRLVREEGSARQNLLTPEAIASGQVGAADLADFTHMFAMLHGRAPSILDNAVARSIGEPFYAPLTDFADSLARDRALLMRMVVMVGPLPRTPGQGDAETAIAAQRHAIELLGTSLRDGCTLGAAVAFMLDWRAVRPLLDATALRLGCPVALDHPPKDSAIKSLIESGHSGEPAYERAIIFGAQQLIIQHAGLWRLLDARRTARHSSAAPVQKAQTRSF